MIKTGVANRAYMTLSLGIRMGIGLTVFVMMARGLGPRNFGLVGAVFAYATIASLLTDFGFSIKTLRDIGERQDLGGSILNSSLNVKILLCAIVLLTGGGIIILLPFDLTSKISILLFAAGIIIASIGDLALTAFRATGNYGGEAKITLWTSLVYLLLVGVPALLHFGILSVAFAFFVSRLIYVLTATIQSLGLFAQSRLTFQPVGHILGTIQGAWAWAMDVGLGYLNSQIDTVLVVYFFGLDATGIYQAGAKFVQASLTISSVIFNIHVPKLAAKKNASILSKYEIRVGLEFVAAGLLIGAALLILGPIITKYLLGPKYLKVDALWPGFAAFVLGRYLAGIFGCTLTAYARPKIRIIGQLVTLLVICVGFYVIRDMGIVYVPWLMGFGGVVTTLVLGCGRIAIANGVPST